MKKYRNIYNGAAPDALVWRNRLGYNEVMTNNYLRHPAYTYYPVVGVRLGTNRLNSAIGRTDRVNEAVLEENGITTRNARYDVEPGEAF